MTLPRATRQNAWNGYEHLHDDDQPWLGVDGITDEQRLWYHFHLECVIRRLYHFQHDQQQASYLNDQFMRLQQLPVDS